MRRSVGKLDGRRAQQPGDRQHPRES
jgi:hypothetical protein